MFDYEFLVVKLAFAAEIITPHPLQNGFCDAVVVQAGYV